MGVNEVFTWVLLLSSNKTNLFELGWIMSEQMFTYKYLN